MLRRKLLAILGSLVLLLVGVAVLAVVLLQGLLGDLRHIQSEALTTVNDVSQLSGKIALIQIELYRLQLGEQRHLDDLLETSEEIRTLTGELGQRYVVHRPEAEAHFKTIESGLPQYLRHVAALATSQDQRIASEHNQKALATAVDMNQSVFEVSRLARTHAQAEQSELIVRFRWIVLGMALAFLLLINASILILLRAAEMVLRPIDRLVEASRALAEEKFETRVQLERSDEFGELAQAYNSLAQNLQASEQRKLETLGQVALTLNHELNNAMTIIELQLELLKRSARGNEGQEKNLRQIRESLQRMAQTVEALKRVRRIVLTDYVGGMKMLDLEKSVQEEPAAEIARPTETQTP